MQKLITDIPLYWLLIWAILSFAITYWFYSKKKWLKDISNVLRISLLALRFTGLFLIGVLVLGILFQSNQYRKEKPIFINVVDNSASIKNYKDSAEVLTKTKDYEQKLNTAFADKFEIVNYTSDGKTVKNYDSLNFDKQGSDLAKVFNDIYEKYYNRNIGGISFLSDGNFNKGGNPIYSAQKIKLAPIFTIGVGDTLVKRDLVVNNVLANDIAFLGNKFPIEVDVEANKVQNEVVNIRLSSKGKTLQNQRVEFVDGDYDIKHLKFIVEASAVGFNSYTISIEKLDGEYNYDNNVKTVYVEVLDARSKVLITANAPHPDLGQIKNVLAGDKNLEIESKLLSELKGDLKQYDLIVWHKPNKNDNPTAFTKLKESGKPIWYFIGANFDNNSIKELNIGLNARNSGQTDDVQSYWAKEFKAFEVSDNLRSALDIFPPVQTNYGKIGLGNNTDVLLYQRLGNVKKKDPLLYFTQNGEVKNAVFYGEGIWRWKIAEYARTQKNTAFEELITKTAQYLVVRNDASNLRVNLPKDISTATELQIAAVFYNDNFELITTPNIQFTLEDESGNKSSFDFNPSDKQYLLGLGKLKSGTYKWIAQTQFNGKKYSKTGALVVKRIDIESLDTRANHALMYQIADNSKGNFYKLTEVDALIKEISNRKDIAPVNYETTKYKDLIDYKWLFALLVLIFGLEWFLRRYNGGY